MSLGRQQATATPAALVPTTNLLGERQTWRPQGQTPRAALAQGSLEGPAGRVPLGPWPESEELCPPGHHTACLLLPLTLPSFL